MIDAAKKHNPDLAPGLIRQCLQITKTSSALAERLGMSREHVSRVLSGAKPMSYGMQVMLERIIDESK